MAASCPHLAQHVMQSAPLYAVLLVWLLCGALPAHAAGAETDATARAWLAKMQAQFPEADADGDGRTTAEEAHAYCQAQKPQTPPQGPPEKRMPPGTSSWGVMVPMRDGVRLHTHVFLPPGIGPWPTVVVRTPYFGQGNSLDFGWPYLKQGMALVGQDVRGMFESEGEFAMLGTATQDGYDTVEWVAAQPWCNGRVGVIGTSAPGLTAKRAAVAAPPHLVVALPSVAASCMDLHWLYQGGVCRDWDRWVRGRNVQPKLWPKPRCIEWNKQKEEQLLSAHADEMPAAMNDVGGWYDIFTPAGPSDFAALRHTGRAMLVMGSNEHDPSRPAGHYPEWSAATVMATRMPGMQWLTDPEAAAAHGSRMYYYLMGDFTDPAAPGNVWKVTERWPVPHAPASFYVQPDGSLASGEPDAEATFAFTYDPHHPVRVRSSGPADQRPLAARADVVRFVSAPLDEPMEITGSPRVVLHAGTDVPDTTFVVKLVDVYPDGYEALVQEGVLMARFRDGLDRPSPVEPGRVYRLEIEMWPTALVVAPGHRIGLYVTGSDATRYEAHPNSYEPVMSYDGAPPAHDVVHVAPDRPTRLVLPVVEPGTVADYAPETP